MNPRLPITFTAMLLLQNMLLAVSPLVTDDADTVEAGKLQLNCDFQFVRTSSTSFYLVPINPVLGLTPRLELGAIFGYQWRDGSGSFPTSDDADDLTDLNDRAQVSPLAVRRSTAKTLNHPLSSTAEFTL